MSSSGGPGAKVCGRRGSAQLGAAEGALPHPADPGTVSTGAPSLGAGQPLRPRCLCTWDGSHRDRGPALTSAAWPRPSEGPSLRALAVAPRAPGAPAGWEWCLSHGRTWTVLLSYLGSEQIPLYRSCRGVSERTSSKGLPKQAINTGRGRAEGSRACTPMFRLFGFAQPLPPMGALPSGCDCQRVGGPVTPLE